MPRATETMISTLAKAEQGRPELPQTQRTPSHAVQFYRHDAALCELASGLIAEAIRLGDKVILVVTAEHRIGIVEWCRTAGIDCVGNDNVEFVDASAFLESVMDGGAPSRDHFARWVRSRAMPGPGRSHRALVLSEIGDLAARRFGIETALAIESWWDALAGACELELVCALAIDAPGLGEADVREICRRHAVVRPDEWSVPDPEEPMNPANGAGPLSNGQKVNDVVARAVRLEREIDVARAEIRRLRHALDIAVEESRRAQEERRHFFDAVSHQLCTPLNAIVGYQDLLELGVGGPVSELQRTYLSRIRKGTRQLIGLVEQLLSLSPSGGSSRPEWQLVDACAIAREVGREARPLCTSKGLRLRLQVPTSPIQCESDPALVQQILLNLLSNAIRFTDHGQVSVRVAAGSSAVGFTVRDTGAGIHPDVLPRIFEPFIQGVDGRFGEGAGLGLAVARRLANDLGGDIHVRSTLGRGSAFTLWLPRQGLAPAGQVPESRPQESCVSPE